MAKTTKGARSPKKPAASKWRPSEVLYAFAGLLTTRKAPLIFHHEHDAAPIGQYLAAFLKVNDLQEPRNNYPKVKVPEGLDYLTNDPSRMKNCVTDVKPLSVNEAADAIKGTLFNLSTEKQNEVIALVLREAELRRVSAMEDVRQRRERADKEFYQCNENLEALRRIREGGLEKLNFKAGL